MDGKKRAGTSAAWVAVAALAGVVCLHAASYGAVVDDAFIAFRYAEHVARGLGPVFNEGERVEGYTDFLWVVLLAGLAALGADLPVAAPLLGIALAASVVPLLYGSARRLCGLGPWVALLPGAIVATSSCFAMWAGAGLETPLYALLVTWALARFCLELRDSSARPVSGLAFALAYLARPEAAGLFVVGGAAALGLGLARPRFMARVAAGFGAVFVPHLVFRLVYYGYPLPNTFYAKTSPGLALVPPGLSYLGGFLLAHGPWALAALVGLGLVPGRRDRALGLLAAGVLAAAAASIVLVGGDFYPYWRFCAPYLPWLALLLSTGAVRLGARLRVRPLGGRVPTASAAAVLAALAVAVPAKLWPDARYRSGVEAARPTARLLASYGRWFREHYPPGTVMALSTVGRVPYYSRLKTIDMLGMTDVHIAHGRLDLDHGMVGHQKYDSDYVLARRPDLVAIALGQHQPGLNPAEITTARIHRELRRGAWGWWPAPADLVGRREFRLDYAPRLAEVEPGKFFAYFERDPALRRLRARVSDTSPAPAAHFRLAMLYRRRGLLDEAVTSMRRAARLDPGRLGPALDVAYFLSEAGRPAEALEEFHRLARRAPREARVRYGLALTLHELGRFAAAVVAWQRYLEVGYRPRFVARARRLLREAEDRADRP